jgi:predicted DNA-binding protein
MKDERRHYPATVSARLTSQQKSQLDKMAWEHHCTKSKILREIIINNLNSEK